MSTQVESVEQRPRERVPAPAEPGPEARTVTILRPPRGWQLINVRELWQFRELLYFLTWRDVKVRYKQTVLGAAWAVLQPALMMVVFTIFFSRMGGVSSGDVPYPLFALAGLLPWTFFATAVANGGNSIVASERLVTKTYFPRLAIPLAAVGAAVVDFLIALGLLAALIVYYALSGSYRAAPGAGLLLAPVIFGVIVLATTGVATLLAALNAAYRDFRYVIPFLLQVWMFATPTVYMQPGEGVSGRFHALLVLNPMTGLIAAFRQAVLGGPIPWGALASASGLALLALLAGCFYFRRIEDTLADIV